MLDYIKLVFHEDMGEGHLEHVLVGQCLSLDIDSDFSPTDYLDFHLTLTDSEGLTSALQRHDDFSLKEHPYSLLVKASPHLRGPPALI